MLLTQFLQNFVIIVVDITDTGDKIEKVQFGRIVDGELKYDDGESGSTVFPGLQFYVQGVNKEIFINALLCCYTFR